MLDSDMKIMLNFFNQKFDVLTGEMLTGIEHFEDHYFFKKEISEDVDCLKIISQTPHKTKENSRAFQEWIFFLFKKKQKYTNIVLCLGNDYQFHPLLGKNKKNDEFVVEKINICMTYMKLIYNIQPNIIPENDIEKQLFKEFIFLEDIKNRTIKLPEINAKKLEETDFIKTIRNTLFPIIDTIPYLQKLYNWGDKLRSGDLNSINSNINIIEKDFNYAYTMTLMIKSFYKFYGYCPEDIKIKVNEKIKMIL